MASLKWLVTGALSALCIPFLSANAQFNAIYGPTNGADQGRGVHQIVNGCMAGNFISVGEGPNPVTPTQSDVYVVITNGAGARISEYRIDIINSNDYGRDFAEKDNGNIVITGYLFAPAKTTSDIFALEFDPCTGTVVWINDYSGSTPTGNETDEAYDIERATDGGFVIAGRSNSLHPNHMDAILLKIDQDGAWRWGTAFGGGASSNEGFFSVTSIGDGSLVAGGYTDVAGSSDIFLARVNGFGTSLSAARYGGASNEGVRSVKVCSQLGANPNHVIVAGNTGSSTALLGLVNYTTMAWTTGRTYKTAAAGWTEAMSVVEVPDTEPETDFVMCGITLNPQGPGKNFEFYLSRVSPNLATVDWYRVHGGNSDDYGWALDLATPIPGDNYSIIATGFRTTNSLGQQLDITRTNQAGVMPCNVAVSVSPVSLTFTPVGMTSCQQLWGLLLEALPKTVRTVTSSVQFCPPVTFSVRPEEQGDPVETAKDGDYYGMQGIGSISQDNVSAGTGVSNEHDIAASAFPNPVKRGSTFNLGYTLRHASYVELSVSDVSGTVIHQTAEEGTAGENRMDVSTEGWTAGTYMVHMRIGDRTITRKVVVSD